MPRTKRSPRPMLPLLLLPLLLMGCGTVFKPLPAPVVKPAAIPPLPAAARQPPTPSECLPTCSEGLTRLRDSWLPSPMPAASAAKPANEPTKH